MKCVDAVLFSPAFCLFVRSTVLAICCALLPTVNAQIVRTLTDKKIDSYLAGVIDRSGLSVYVTSSSNQFGTNPRHAFQIDKWDVATGQGTQLTAFEDGVEPSAVSVTNDDQWLAFVSRSNLVGTNHDESPEIFIMRSNGSGIVQLTDHAFPSEGSVLECVISGSGNRILFRATTNPLGINPEHHEQLFVVNTDGSGLMQLSTGAGSFHGFSISDDGQRAVFAYDGDIVGENPDFSVEVFTVTAEGTIKQITSCPLATSGHCVGDSLFPALSGNGNTIVFYSNAEMTDPNPSNDFYLYSVGWSGAGVVRLAQGFQPSITDDGQFVFYSTQENDTNSEVWRITSDGASATQITDTDPPVQNGSIVVSGDGSRVVFVTNSTGRMEQWVMDADGSNMQQLTATEAIPGASDSIPDITDDGTRIVFVSYANHLGTDPEIDGEIYRVEADGSGLTQVTHFVDAEARDPSVSADGSTIVFWSRNNLTGQNPCEDRRVFRVFGDGTGLSQLTPGTECGLFWDESPTIASNGSFVVFQSVGDYTGANPDLSPEIFRVRPDGSDMMQLTSLGSDWLKFPRVSANGTWVVFQSLTNPDGANPDESREIWRVRVDGTMLERLTADPEYGSWSPDITGNGDLVVYVSNADPLRMNPNHDSVIFAYEPATDVRRQLTVVSPVTLSSGTSAVRVSEDGAYVYFVATEPVFEPVTEGELGPYRVALDTGVIERVGALQHRASLPNPGQSVVTNGDGSVAVFVGRGDWIDENPDRNAQLWLVDYSTPPTIVASKAAPTIVAWSPEPRFRRYDIIRGDVASLAPATGTTIDLGPVVCIEDDSPDTDTVGNEDIVQPDAGQAFFYLYRGVQGVFEGPGSWGEDSSGRTRVPSDGDCTF